MASKWSLQGTTALVTGGTRGLGHAIVEELASLGVSVYTCSRTQSELDECLQNWNQKGYKVFGSTCDILQPSQRETLIQSVSNQFDGKLTILVNNVAKLVPKDSLSSNSQDFTECMGTTVEASYNFCQLAHPLLKASGNASIVFISACASYVYVPYHTIYAATKGAVDSLVKNLACEWASDKIRVNAVAPWLMRTPLTEGCRGEFGAVIDALVRRTVEHRLVEPAETAAVVAFLCFPAASAVTGQTIRSDCGAYVYGL